LCNKDQLSQRQISTQVSGQVSGPVSLQVSISLVSFKGHKTLQVESIFVILIPQFIEGIFCWMHLNNKDFFSAAFFHDFSLFLIYHPLSLQPKKY